MHQRPGIGHAARIEARRERAIDDLHGEQDHEPSRPFRRARSVSGQRTALAVQVENRPQHQREHGEGRAQVDGQAIVAHIGVLLQPAHHHEPAQRGYDGTAEHDPQRAPQQPPPQQAAAPEDDERHEEHQAHQPAPVAVQPLPEEDALEAGQVHVPVQQLILGDPLVLLLPRGLAQRRQRARDGFPLGDAEAALGKPCDAPDGHHARDHDAACEQPRDHWPHVSLVHRRRNYRGDRARCHGTSRRTGQNPTGAKSAFHAARADPFVKSAPIAPVFSTCLVMPTATTL